MPGLLKNRKSVLETFYVLVFLISCLVVSSGFSEEKDHLSNAGRLPLVPDTNTGNKTVADGACAPVRSAPKTAASAKSEIFLPYSTPDSDPNALQISPQGVCTADFNIPSGKASYCDCKDIGIYKKDSGFCELKPCDTKAPTFSQAQCYVLDSREGLRARPSGKCGGTSQSPWPDQCDCRGFGAYNPGTGFCEVKDCSQIPKAASTPCYDGKKLTLGRITTLGVRMSQAFRKCSASLLPSGHPETCECEDTSTYNKATGLCDTALCSSTSPPDSERPCQIDDMIFGRKAVDSK